MIVIVGAGLAGLVCAKQLHEARADFLLLEASNRPGGRVRTLRTEGGFTLDAGFQVLLDSYPAAVRHLDIPALDPRYFDSGAIVYDDGDFFRVMNPIATMEWLLPSIFSPAFPWTDRIQIAALIGSCLAHGDQALLARCKRAGDESTATMLHRLGFSDMFLRRFVQPFFGGVFLDAELETSAGLFTYYLKKFATGRVLVPSRGMEEIPRQLAARLPGERIRYHARVIEIRVENGGACAVLTDSGDVIPAGHVVLATDEPATNRLLHRGAPRAARSACVVYLICERSLYTGPILVLPAGPDRLVRHLIQVTNVAPEVSPPGIHLVSATVLDPGSHDDASLGASVINEIETIFPEVRGFLRQLCVLRIPYALIRHPGGFASSVPGPPPIRRLTLAGDQTSSSSINAAMQSGEDAAKSALEAA